MGIGKVLGIFVGFCAILVIAYMSIGFGSSVAVPDINTSAGQQYSNLSKVTTISSTGIQGFLLLVLLALVLGAVYLVYNAGSKR